MKAQKSAPVRGPRGSGGVPRGESRAEKTARVRQQIIEEGLRQFRLRGFDAVPVEAIIRRIDVSVRTFFRYFNTKEDLVFTWLDELGEVACPSFAERLDQSSLLEALRGTFRHLAAYISREPDRPALVTELIFSTPSLNGRYQNEHMRWEDEFLRIAQSSGHVAERDVFAAKMRITLAVAAWIGALRAWADDGHGSPLIGYVDAAFGILMQREPTRRA